MNLQHILFKGKDHTAKEIDGTKFHDGDVRWCATEDKTQGPGTGRHVAMFILEPG